jgi:hypothetical protein
MKPSAKLAVFLGTIVLTGAILFPPVAKLSDTGLPIFQGYAALWSMKPPLMIDPHYYPAELTIVFSVVGMIITLLI